MGTLEIAAIGLQQDLDRLKATSHNLANTSTAGYKRQIAVQRPFAGVMDATATSIASTYTDARAGKLAATGNALDIAMPDGRYLLLEQEDGTQVLSRDGALQLDAAGSLRTMGGLKVLGQRGGITVRAEQRGSLAIDGQGQLRSGDQVLDALRMVSLKAGQFLQPLGAGTFTADANQWDVDSPLLGVRSAFLEQSNVMPSQEMAVLMSTTRHAESMVRLLQTADEMAEKAIRRFGEHT